MIDAHCHLDNPQFKELPDLSGLEAVVTAGGSLVSSRRCVELANKHPKVYAAVGLGYEPKYKNWNNLKKELLKLAENRKVVGIGECGLDSDNPNEGDLLKFHLELALETDLPLVVHNWKQDERLLKILGDAKKVMIHCFTSERQFANVCAKRGWYMSFGGILTFKKSNYLRDLIKEVLQELLIIETDSPYLAPEPVRGEINQPRNIKLVAEELAKVCGLSCEEIDKLTTQNTQALFSKLKL